MYRENRRKAKKDRELIGKSEILGETVKIPEKILLEIIGKEIAGKELTGKELIVLNSMGTRKQIFLETIVSRINQSKELEKEGKTLEVTPKVILEIFKKRMETLTKPPFVMVIKTIAPEVPAPTTPATPAPTVAPPATQAEPTLKGKVLWPVPATAPTTTAVPTQKGIVVQEGKKEKISQKPKERPAVENKKFVRPVRVKLIQFNKEKAELGIKYQNRYMIPIIKEGMPFVLPEKEGFCVGVWWEGEEPEFYVGETPIFPIRILPVQTTLEGDYLLVARTESLEVELNLKPLGDTVVFIVKDNIDSVWIRNEEEERPFKPMMGTRSRVYQELCAEEKKSSPMGKNSWRMDERGIITPPLTGTAMSEDEVLDVIQKTLSEDRAKEEEKVTVPETVAPSAGTPVPA